MLKEVSCPGNAGPFLCRFYLSISQGRAVRFPQKQFHYLGQFDEIIFTYLIYFGFQGIINLVLNFIR